MLNILDGYVQIMNNKILVILHQEINFTDGKQSKEKSKMLKQLPNGTTKFDQPNIQL